MHTLLEDLGVDGKVILEWIVGTGLDWTEFIWLRIGPSGWL
jgi:hypothetical protein